MRGMRLQVQCTPHRTVPSHRPASRSPGHGRPPASHPKLRRVQLRPGQAPAGSLCELRRRHQGSPARSHTENRPAAARAAWSRASASTIEPNIEPPQPSRQPLTPAESREPEEPTSSSACCLVAGAGEHRRAEHEAAAVITGSPGRQRRAARPKNRPAAARAV